MKGKSLIAVFGVIILIVIAGIIVFKQKNMGEIMDGPGMINEFPDDTEDVDNTGETSFYSVVSQERGEFPGEDIYVYDNNGNLVLSLEDKDEPQYLFTLYEKSLVLDSGTSASQREMLVYDIPSGKIIFKTDYYPGENGLVLDGDSITFYKEIDESLYGDYTLPNCENEYDNGYIENYGYTIGEDQVNDLGDIQCAYFE